MAVNYLSCSEYFTMYTYIINLYILNIYNNTNQQRVVAVVSIVVTVDYSTDNSGVKM